MKQLRLPLFLRINLVVFLFAGLSVGVAGIFYWNHHKNAIFNEKLQSAGNILDFLTSIIKIPLLIDDTLRLSGVIADAADIEGVVYTFVLDRNQAVQAKSELEKFDERRRLVDNGKIISTTKGIVVVQFTDPYSGQIYDLSKMITYQKTLLGTIHLGFSSEFIKENLDAAGIMLLKSLYGMAVSLSLVLIVLSALYTMKVKRRTSSLIRAVDEFGSGNLRYRIQKIENNESGDVVQALHRMSNRLLVQEPSQDKLEQYLKISSLERILDSPVYRGESYAFRRQVAVFFVTIKGFGSYAGREDPENIVRDLNKYISIVTRTISKHGGYVDKVIGDAVVGIFGVSLYHENHTSRAVQAALDLQEALSAGNENESQLLSNVCVGISSGIVLSGNIGACSKIEYSSIGDSIKEAYWLSNLGHPGEIILGEEIYIQMKDSVQAETLPLQTRVGGSDLIKSFRFLGFTEKKNEME